MENSKVSNQKAPQDIRLLADRVMVEIIADPAKEQVLASGLIIPATVESDSMDKPQIGEVINVSARVTRCDVEEDKVAVGEKVIFSQYAGTTINYEGKEYKLLRITDLFGAV